MNTGGELARHLTHDYCKGGAPFSARPTAEARDQTCMLAASPSWMDGGDMACTDCEAVEHAFGCKFTLCGPHGLVY